MIVVLLCLSSGTGGCTSSRPTIRSIWEQVPTVRWTGRLLESETRAGDSSSPSEPVVAANVAVKIDSENSAGNTKESTPGGRSSKTSSSDDSPHAHPLDHDSPANRAVTDSDQKSLFDLTSENDRSDSAMERLNSALMGNSLQRQALPERSLTSLDERVEVDSLLSQARQLLDRGQLDQALEIAQQARQIGDAAHLEYSPDEERPSDLISRIQGHQEAARLKIDPKFEDFAGSSPTADEPNQDAANDHQKKTPESKDGRGLSRIRRDISTLFRREKKSSSTSESESAAPARKTSSSMPEGESKSREQQAAHKSVNLTRDAIVMANRSVSLGPPEESSSPSVDAVNEGRDDFPPEPNLSIASTIADMDEERDDAPARSASLPARTTLSPQDELEADGVASMPTDFQAVESTSAFQDMASPRNSRVRDDQSESHEPLREADWTIYYIVFGLCSLYAVRCYRCGAT